MPAVNGGTDLTALTGAGTASGDLFILWDVSAGDWVSITRAELLAALTSGLVTVGSLKSNSSATAARNIFGFDGSTEFGVGFLDTSAGAGGQIAHRFMRNAADVGSITTTNVATAYNTSSDLRLKEDFEPLEDVGSVIDALQPTRWKWRLDGSMGFGFIAQDLAEVVPEAVQRGDDDADKRPGDEGFVQWSRDDTKLIPLLVAEIKALRQRVAALELE